MIAIPDALITPAKEAGMDVPDDPDNYDAEKYPYFHTFCCAQLGEPMPNWSAHFNNALVIAKLKPKQLKTITMNQLIKRGFQIGYS